MANSLQAFRNRIASTTQVLSDRNCPGLTPRVTHSPAHVAPGVTSDSPELPYCVARKYPWLDGHPLYSQSYYGLDAVVHSLLGRVPEADSKGVSGWSARRYSGTSPTRPRQAEWVVVNPLPAGLLRLRHRLLQGSYEFPHSSSRQRRVAGTSLSRFGRAPPFRSLSQNGYGFAAPILAHMWLPKAA